MKISGIHKITSLLLSTVMLISVAVSAQYGILQLCDMMEAGHHSTSMSMTDMENCPMESGMKDHSSSQDDSDHCESAFVCDCDSDEVFNNT